MSTQARDITVRHFNKGVALFEEGDLEGALASFQEASEYANNSGFLEIEGALYENLGGVLEGLGRRDEAFEWYFKILELSDLPGDIRALALNKAGSFFVDEGRFEEALELYREAVVICEQNASVQDHCCAVHDLAALYAHMGEYEKAREGFERALEMVDDPKKEATICYNLGRVLVRTGSKDPVPVLKRARELSGDRERVRELSLSIGQVLLDEDKYEEATFYLEDAMPSKEQVEGLQKLAQFYPSKHEDIVIISQRLLEEDPQFYLQAILTSLQALDTPVDEILSSVPQKHRETMISLLEDRAETKEELELLLPLLPAEKAAAARNKLAALLAAEGDYKRAMEMFRVCLEEYEGNPSGQSMILNNLGKLLADTGSLDEAKKTYEQALQIYVGLFKEEPDNPSYKSYASSTMKNLSSLLCEMGRPEDGKRMYDLSQEIINGS